MKSLLKQVFEDLIPKPQILPQQKLGFKELRQLIKAEHLREEWINERNKQGLHSLEISMFFFQFLNYPILLSTSWEKLSVLHPVNSLEYALTNWCLKLEKTLNHPQWFQGQIDLFESWLKKMEFKYSKDVVSNLDKNLLMNIWVDYEATKVFLLNVDGIPSVLKTAFIEQLNELNILIFNVNEFFDQNISNFMEGKGAVYGSNRKTLKYRIPKSHLIEIKEIVENIKKLNHQFLNKGINKIWLVQFNKELAKLNIELFQKGCIRRLKESVIPNSKISERLHYDILNDFLLALKFTNAITEADEDYFLNKESVLPDTIRQMKKRFINGVISI